MASVDALLKYINNNKGLGDSMLNVLSGFTSGSDAYDRLGGNISGLNGQIQYLSDMYNPNGAVAQQMARELAAKDARAGRNSQYAARSAMLQAQLARGATSNAGTIAQLLKQKQDAELSQQQVRANQLGSLFDLAKRTGAVDWAGRQLGSLFDYNQDQGINTDAIPKSALYSDEAYGDWGLGNTPSNYSNDVDKSQLYNNTAYTGEEDGGLDWIYN